MSLAKQIKTCNQAEMLMKVTICGLRRKRKAQYSFDYFFKNVFIKLCTIRRVNDSPAEYS